MTSKSLFGSLMNIFVADDDIKDYPSDTIEFYSKFIEEGFLKGAFIDSAEKLHDKDKKIFTAYNILVTTDHLEFVIKKRFREFYRVYKKVRLPINPKVKHKYDFSQYNIEFPKRHLFGNLDDRVIEERKDILNRFLTSILELYLDAKNFELLEFLEIRSFFVYKKEHYLINGINLSDCTSIISAPRCEMEIQTEQIIKKHILRLNSRSDNIHNTLKLIFS